MCVNYQLSIINCQLSIIIVPICQRALVICFDGDNSRANRMQSQACLSYAEVQPRLAVSFER